MNADHPGTAVTNEIWLGKPPPARPPFDVLRVITRQTVQEGLAGDPLARGSLLALVVASLAGVGLALAGLLLVVVADLRDERGELFDLEAQGAAPGRCGATCGSARSCSSGWGRSAGSSPARCSARSWSRWSR